MPRKTLDIDSELDALRAKIEKRLTSQKLTLGEIVLESGVHKLFDADQLKEALVRLRDEAAAVSTKGGKAAGAHAGFPARGGDQSGAESPRGRAADLLGQAAAE